MHLALVIDVECWYHSEYLQPYLPPRLDDQMPESVLPMLELLDRYDTKATFAVLGVLAERYPGLVSLISEKGHEIASHGYSHRMLGELGEEEFKRELALSVDLLTSITGQRPVGFRAPSFSMDNSTAWALRILHRHGFEYDASVFPVSSGLYGVPGAPLGPYRPCLDDITSHDPDGTIVEFPMTVWRMGVTVPIAGGFYLRVLPYWFLKLGLAAVLKHRPGILYVHPWETHGQTPRLRGVPPLARIVAYHGLETTARKFERLLADFAFKPVRHVLADTGIITNSWDTAHGPRD